MTCWYTSLAERDLSEGRSFDGMIIFKWGKGKGYSITAHVFWDHKLCWLVNIPTHVSEEYSSFISRAKASFAENLKSEICLIQNFFRHTSPTYCR